MVSGILGELLLCTGLAMEIVDFGETPVVKTQPGRKEADEVNILTFFSSRTLVCRWDLLLAGFSDKPEDREPEAG